MSRWLTFYMERLPPAVLLLTAGGIALTSQTLACGVPTSPLMGAWAVIISMAFFLELRLMDELKDAGKDRIAHQDRPIPRGLITDEDARKGIHVGLAVMVLLGLVTTLIELRAGVTYLVCIFYLWLMYHEFFVGKWLEAKPFLYAVTHQLIILPLCAAFVLIVLPQMEPVSITVLLRPGLLFMGSFFTFEVCRKLDPAAHEVLGTYRTVYGLFKTGLMLVFTLSILAAGLWISLPVIGSGAAGAIAAAALMTLLCYIFCAGSRYKLVEGIATLLLLMTLWLPFVLITFFA